MSVLSYLQQRASAAVLNGAEKTSISRSIATLKTRLDAYFEGDLEDHFQFGSSTRGTILPRDFDERSDIDYMIVFRDTNSTPQTYLDRLRRFFQTYYGRSEVYQSSPTIVLELNHIKFDLVPATRSWWDGTRIPDGRGSWQATNPTEFSKKLEGRNMDCGSLLKPAIRLVKYWNAANRFPFDSYELEQWIVGCSYWGASNLRDYVFAIFQKFDIDRGWSLDAQTRVKRAKQLVGNVIEFERQQQTARAETELRKLIPE
ncbi:MAG TPA: nucleotidyltransferase [Ideonella sp.]|uniref:SMODS domain-containing nucleotidyltransferase n=1 Tax=Ideonella sp. TaxID=1929293 RepID=UPI002CAED75E|nr:nucleotidyltransferase [Ideonella sp.]HSI49169.1 nucleotidyltransferase [Ideonella sp.]